MQSHYKIAMRISKQARHQLWVGTVAMIQCPGMDFSEVFAGCCNATFILGNYECHDRIGAGSFGSVFKAWHKLTGRRVAMKLFEWSPDDSSDEFDNEKSSTPRSQGATIATIGHPKPCHMCVSSF